MVHQTRIKACASQSVDDFLADYLAEFEVENCRGQPVTLNDDDSIEVAECSPIGPHTAWFSCQTIPREKRIIATISVERNGQSKQVRQQSESLLVLLQCLHFLNHPLSSSLRRSFLSAAEKSIDDFRSADFCTGEWQLAVASCSGVMSEVA